MSSALSTSVTAELGQLRALARALVRGDADADDLVQDTVEATLRHPPALDRPLGGWLATVLRNRFRMDHRGDRRRDAREATAGELGDAPATPEALHERAELLSRLTAALTRLDEPLRTTVMLRYLDGRSAAEIARATSVPAGTVRWRLKTGLERLRAELDGATPRDRWQRALLPLLPTLPELAPGGGTLPLASLVKGALAVKLGTKVILAVLALAGLAAFFVVRRGSSTPDAPTPPPTQVATRVPTIPDGRLAARAPGDDGATPPATAPAAASPGQARAVVSVVAAPHGRFSGRVINWSTGAGVAGAELTFAADGPAESVRTAEDGTFSFAPASGDRYTLAAATCPGYLPYAPEWQHSPVRLLGRADRSVDALTIFLFPAVDYHGVVIDAKGEIVAGAKVRLLGSPSGEQILERLESEWTSDAKGEFVFHAQDDAVLEATFAGKRGRARLGEKATLTHVLEIRLGDEPPLDQVIAGRVVDEKGDGVGEVLVSAYPSADPKSGAAGVAAEQARARAATFATTDEDGRFSLSGVDRSTYVVIAELDELAPARLSGVRGGKRDLTITLSAGERLAGRVRTTSGEPVPSFTLLVERRKGAGRELVVSRAVADADGRFSVQVPAGSYDLTAAAAGWAPSPPTLADAGGAEIELTVSSGATLRGRVISAADGTPLPYARITREASGGGSSAQPANAGTVTDEQGAFELTGIPPGRVAVFVAAGNHHPKIEAGMTATDGAVLPPLVSKLTPLEPGETPQLELVGIGVQLVPDETALRVAAVIPGGGAEAAGVVAGDLVLAVDGRATRDTGQSGAVALIRGAPGTTVQVTIQHGAETRTLTIERKALPKAPAPPPP